MNAILAIACLFPMLIFHFIISFGIYLVPRRFRRKKDIKGQIVLITGAGSGLGRQLAIQFSKHSTSLVLLDINEKTLLETKDLVSQQHSTVFAYQCDISNSKMVYEVAEKIKKDVGDVDILVNNAGIVVGKSLLNLPEEKIVKTMEVNALAHFWMCKAFLPAMMIINKGHIVSIASNHGKIGATCLTDYCASNYAAIGFAESLELELFEKKLDGIKLTIVYTSHMDTGMFKGEKQPLFSVLTPQYVAEEIVAAVLEEQEIIYIPSHMSYIFLLKELSPRWLKNWLQDKIGGLRAMDNFIGRSEKPKFKDET